MNLEHISLLMELLKSPISPIKRELLETLNSATIRKLTEKLGIDNVRIYIYNTAGRELRERQITGDSKKWSEVKIELIKEDVAVYKNLHFIKIYYFNDDGRTITFGYLGVYREKILINSELGLLQLFCRLYGDYVRKRIALTIKNKTLSQLKNIATFATSTELPGTKILKVLDSLHRATNAYTSYYCIIDENSVCVDYAKRSNQRSAFYPMARKINTSDNFIKSLDKTSIVFKAFDLSIKSLFDNFYKFDKTLDENFLFYVYPTRYNDIVIGCWILIFSNRQFFDKDEVNSLVEISDSLIKINYKYLYQRKTQKMIVEPIFKSRDTRIDNNKIFVLMPFTLEWSNRIWQQMIKPTIEANGYEALRADDLYGQDIVEDIWSSILSAHLVIADITGRNPNVFYELGIAHTLGKKVILISQDTNDIPFDLNRYRHIIYKDNYDGYEILKNKLEGAIKELGN